MPSPLLHSQATGVHPAAYVQATAPANPYVVAGVSYALPDRVLWVDTSTPEPYQLRVWNAALGRWQAIGRVQAQGLDTLAAGYGDLLWYDGFAWRTLGTDGQAGNVLTEVPSTPGLQPLWSVPAVPAAPPPVPVPAGVDPDQYRCAIAQWLAAKLIQAYTLEAAVLQAQAASNLGLLTDITGGLLNMTSQFTQLRELVAEVFGKLAYVPQLITGFVVTLAKAYLAWSLLPIPPNGQEDVARTLYCNMYQAPDGSWPITSAVLDGWRHALVAPAIAADFVAAPLGASVSQQLVLEETIAVISLYQWQLWAHAASDTQSSVCGAYSCVGVVPAAATGALALTGGALLMAPGRTALTGGASLLAAGRTAMTGGAQYAPVGGKALTGGAAL